MTADGFIPVPKASAPVDRSTRLEKPGALQGQVWLTLQTRQAQQLVHGRAVTPGKPAIIGLVGFADRLRVIWQAARGDDPYADWWLIKVHEAIEGVACDIGRQQADLDRWLEQTTALAVSVAASQRPYRVQLQFANPYAYRAAQLLADYDHLLCTAFTARHIGLLDSGVCVYIRRAHARKLRALFMVPQQYRFLKINRDAVRRQTGRSHEARQLMSEVPEDILNGKRQAPLVPSKVKFPTRISGDVELRSEPATGGNHRADDENDDS